MHDSRSTCQVCRTCLWIQPVQCCQPHQRTPYEYTQTDGPLIPAGLRRPAEAVPGPHDAHEVRSARPDAAMTSTPRSSRGGLLRTGREAASSWPRQVRLPAVNLAQGSNAFIRKGVLKPRQRSGSRTQPTPWTPCWACSPADGHSVHRPNQRQSRSHVTKLAEVAATFRRRTRVSACPARLRRRRWGLGPPSTPADIEVAGDCRLAGMISRRSRISYPAFVYS